ncbi:hypothetical protein Bca52824_079792 [Brassica carinata]|uniref:BHLH domain-containing protein n=1 Tax=Brassica carinata TaxID=52824 RepID=A0A8X7Q0A7_BRACI|nr:hypothetical protein Bca52824_079792 [Brassica carinata]
MGLEWTNDVESLALKDQDISVRARSDEDRITNGLKWSDDYFYYHQANFHLQIVPENRKEEENSEKDLTLVVPDEHSETGDHHLHIKDYSEYNRRFFKKGSFSDKKSSKRRIRDDMMSNKMRTLQQLVPNCHKTDKVSVLDKTIEYMKNLQLQLQVMSIMGTNPYIPQATLDFGMHNQLLTAMGIAHGLNPAKQTTLSPNLSFPHSSNQSLFPPPASSPQCLCGLVRCFPTFFDFSSNTMGALMNSRIFITIVLSYIIGSIHAYDPDALQDLCTIRRVVGTPHTHPRATEVVYVLEGLCIFRKNNGRSPASILSVFNSQLPGAVSVAATLFTAEPALSEDVLTKTFQVKSKMVDKIKERLATKK